MSMPKTYLRGRAATDEASECDVDAGAAEDKLLGHDDVRLAGEVAGRNLVPHLVVKSENIFWKYRIQSLQIRQIVSMRTRSEIMRRS